MFQKRKSKLSRRITWRVILIMLFFNAFVVAAVIVFDLGISRVESAMRAQNIINGIGGKLVTTFRSVEVAAINNVSEIEDHLDSPEAVYGALEHEVLLNKSDMGSYVAFESNYFPKQGHWFEPYVYLKDSTLVERKQLGAPHHDYFAQDWYKKGISLERGKGYLSDPYFDNAGGMRILSSFVMPVFDRQGRKVGVYGIDLNLDWLKQSIADEEQKVREASLLADGSFDDSFFVQVVDSKGKKIAGSETLDAQVIKTILGQESIGFKEIQNSGETYMISTKRLGHSGWTLVVAQHKDFVLLYGYILAVIIIFLMVLSSIVVIFFIWHGIKHAVKPLLYLSDSAQEVAHGNFDTPLPTFRHNDEITQLRDSFDTMQQSLKRYVAELQESTAAKASIESELNVAHAIQRSMLPNSQFLIQNSKFKIKLNAMQKPAKAVGGDLYDYFLRDEKLFFCIGDVSGKGVPASLVMAVTRTLFRNVAAHTAEPQHIVETMNANICEGNENCMFVTLYVGVLDLKTGLLRYSNAGHDAPYILSSSQPPVQESAILQTPPVPSSSLPCDPNLPIGVLPGFSYTVQEMQMAPGTIIFLYTDGLTEAETHTHEQFGEERMQHVMKLFSGTPQELIDTMTLAVHHFVGDTEQSDDLTMLAIQYQP